jgi:hypothetical protein
MKTRTICKRETPVGAKAKGEIYMRRFLLRAIATLIPVFLLGLAALAQNRPDDRGYNQSYGTGDYRDTCQHVRWDGTMLYAQCQTRDGDWRNTSIDSRDCGGQILNLNGRLACGQAGYQQEPNGRPYDNDRDRGYDRGSNGGNWQSGLPPGDYQLTCQDMRMDGDRLEARCEKRNGGWRSTSLDDVQRCNSPIVNNNGRLSCQR